MCASTADGKMGRMSTGVRAWHTFCLVEGLTPNRPLDPNSSLQQKLLEEQLCMRFCAALVEDRNLKPSTIATYFGQLQGWHSKEHGIRLCAGLKLNRLPAMIKGLRRILGDTPQAIRRGIAPQMLRKAFDLVLDPSVPAHANIRAALALALQGLLRGSEFAVDEGKAFNSARHLTRADVRVLTDSQLVIMMLPCKKICGISMVRRFRWQLARVASLLTPYRRCVTCCGSTRRPMIQRQPRLCFEMWSQISHCELVLCADCSNL